jgi:REP element-mobilizing transposase RayT
MRARQADFFKDSPDYAARLEHGAGLRKGRRKLARPLDPRKSVHLVLRSSRAKGAWSMGRSDNERKIQRLLNRQARRFGIRIYQFANVGNHLHLLLRAPSREAFRDFLRTFSGLVARLVTGEEGAGERAILGRTRLHTRGELG